MSNLSNALSNFNSTGGVSRLRGGTAQMGVTATKTFADPSYESKSQLLGTVGKLAEVGADSFGKYDANQKSKADERSNQIIRSLTPEQRRQAIENGTLLYQDDPYAMKALKEKTGRNAAFLVDDDVALKVKNGEFRTRDEMEQYRQTKMTEGAKSFAETFGISETDEDYQRGFNSDITERNISLYGAHDSFVSDQAKKGAIINSRVELNSVLNDPTTLRSPHAGEFYEAYFKNGLTTGSIPSDDQAYAMVSQSLSDVVNREGGSQFLQQIQDRKITLNGKESTYKDLLGAEQWNNLSVKAQSNEFNLNAKRMEDFKLSINSALNQDDTSKGWEMLQTQKAALDKIQVGEEVTPERQALITAETQMQDRLNRESAETVKAMDKAQKTINKQSVIQSQYDKRMNGQYVSTDFKDMPTNENTGEFTHSDMVNFANKTLMDIDNMNISEPQKDQLKLKYLRADSKEGAFRTAAGELITDAENEWQAGVINGKLPEDTVALNALRKMRNTDPDLFASLYPDKAEMFLTMDMMDKQGIDVQVLLDADKARKSRTKEMQYEDDKAFEGILNDGKAKDLARMPASMREGARKMYDSVKYRGGNSDMAMQQISKYLKDSTTTFKRDDVDGKTIGMVTKESLRVTDDPDSWKQGQAILDAAITKVTQVNPWITNQQVTVMERGESIYLMDTTGNVHLRYDKQLLTKEYQRAQQIEDAKVRDKAIAGANKKTLHTKAMNRKRETNVEREKRIADNGGLYGGLK